MPTRTYDLVGSKEAAQLLGIGSTNFSHLARKMREAGDTNFPEPVLQLAMGPLWERKAMEKFQKHYEARRRRVRSANGDTVTVETVKATPAKKAAATKAPAKKAAAKPRKTVAKGTEATVSPLRPKTIKRAAS